MQGDSKVTRTNSSCSISLYRKVPPSKGICVATFLLPDFVLIHYNDIQLNSIWFLVLNFPLFFFGHPLYSFVFLYLPANLQAPVCVLGSIYIGFSICGSRHISPIDRQGSHLFPIGLMCTHWLLIYFRFFIFFYPPRCVCVGVTISKRRRWKKKLK